MAGFGLPGCCLQAVGSCVSLFLVGPPMGPNLKKKANLEGKSRA